MKTRWHHIRSIRFQFLLTALFVALFASLTVQAGALCYGMHLPSAFAKIRTEGEIKTLKIMAYNVENLFTSVGKYEWTADFQMKKVNGKEAELKPESDTEWIRDIILKRDPDFLIGTEVENQLALQVLATRKLQGRYKALLVEGNDSRGIDIGFLIKSDLPWKVRIKSHKNIQFKDPKTGEKGPLFSRDLPVLEVFRENQPDKILFVIIGNHAKSKRDRDSDPESNRWRTAQYAEAAKIIRSYKDRGILTILGGDFNTDTRYAPEVAPVRNELRSVFDVADQATPSEGRITHTYHPKNGKTESSQIDDIMVSPELSDMVLRAEVVRYVDENGNVMPFAKTYDERSKQPSDHLPVDMEIRTDLFF